MIVAALPLVTSALSSLAPSLGASAGLEATRAPMRLACSAGG